MLNIGVHDEALRRVLQQLQQRGQNAVRLLVPVVRNRLQTITGQAKNKTPVAESSLRRSGQSEASAVGNEVHGQIQFGGLAAAYAEVQHEADGFRHTLPAGVSRSMTTRKYRTGRGDLRPRKRKHPLKGYRGGQAHWLHGRSTSAWNAGEESRLLSDLLNTATAELESVLRGARGD